MARLHFILFVQDQAASMRFYSAALGRAPILDVPGMTEFSIGDALPDPALARGIPRSETYLVVAFAREKLRDSVGADR